MNKFYLVLFASTLFFNSFSQYCTTVGPTSNIDSNVESVTLIGASGSINYTGCPGVIGLQNLSATQVVTLNAGGTYTITVDFGTCGGNFNGVGQVWVDFNSDVLEHGKESLLQHLFLLILPFQLMPYQALQEYVSFNENKELFQ
jgi:hypothetical protein